MVYDRMKILAGNGNLPLAKSIANFFEKKLVNRTCETFSNGEIKVKLQESVRGSDLYIVQSTPSPGVNDYLMELFFLVDAARRSGAHRITAVLPFIGYTRQDRATGSEPLSMSLIGKFCHASGIERFIFVDLHNVALQNAFSYATSLFDLSSKYVFAPELKKRGKITLAPPDLGAAKKVGELVEVLGCEMVQVIKKRDKKSGKPYVESVIGDVNEKNVYLCDDIIDTGGSIKVDADALRKRGAKSVSACATHALLTGDSVANLNNAGLDELIISDTVSLSAEKGKLFTSKVTIVSWAELLAKNIIQPLYKDSPDASVGNALNYLLHKKE